MNVLRTGNPNRIWNMDETAIYTNPSGGLVIAERGKAASKTGASDKENLTVLVSVNAAGDIGTPFALWGYTRFSKAVLDKKPKEWTYGKTKKGWMTSQSFYKFIANDYRNTQKALLN